ncbi:MAG: DUF1015 domain-containing protein [Dehalococcoidia bacterium]
MTEIRPFRGLRYDAGRVTPDDVVAPPFDVVSEDDVRALHARSPYNIAHVESSRGVDDSRFTGAAAALDAWEREGVLVRDDAPRYYAYEQRFSVQGAIKTRRAFFAQVRLYRPEERVVRPHEGTMSGPKAERLALMRATNANISPIFSMYTDGEGRAGAVLASVVERAPDFEATDGRGDRHRLWVIDGASELETLTGVLEASDVTIADGHHRYATALTYHEERGDEASGWVLMGLVAADDPGLLILPNHRLVRVDERPADLRARLEELYVLDDITPKSWDGTAIHRLWGRVQANAGGAPTFGLVGLEEQHLHVLTARSRDAIDRAMPQSWSAASRGLDVSVLTETILKPGLGLDEADLAAGERVTFTEEVEEVWRRAEQSHNVLGFLVNPTRVDQVIAVADADELMPQKATFFYPKLGTGLVLNRLD